MVDRLRVRAGAGAAYPEAAALRVALRGGDWAAGRAVLDGAGRAERSALMRMVDGQRGTEKLLGRVVAERPTDTTAAALLAFRQVEVAWRIRTHAQAGDVSRRRFARFHAALDVAEKTVVAGLGADESDPALWTASLVTARGLELGPAVSQYRYAKLAEIDPHHLPGQRHMLQQLCPKWGGSWERAFGFAREAMFDAPEGTPNAVLLAEAHLEYWLESGSKYYLSSPGVREGLTIAAQRSVLHPAFERTIGWVEVVNTFAMAFAMAGERAAAAEMFTALGPYFSDRPWSYHPDPIAAFRLHRAASLGWSWPSVLDRLMALTGATSRRAGLALLGLAWR
ncbi:hypothetical protein AB0J83_23185 [Actinoplanes sp. NPDC049596]|uniref:hypothetical protein n=1 Tax=unclassified Actinoplanes TaxID=2626549 RepID=UPI00341ABA1F